MSQVRSVMALVRMCETRLGWFPDGDNLLKARRIEASKLKRAMATDPARLTLFNLQLALELCASRREEIRSPYMLIYRVDDALKLANAETTAVGEHYQLIDEAIAVEMGRTDQERDYWIGRLTRAAGPARIEVLQEWKDARGQIQIGPALLVTCLLALIILPMLVLAYLGGWLT